MTDVQLVGHAHAAVQLHRLICHELAGIADLGLGARSQPREAGLTLAEAERQMLHQRQRLLMRDEHVDHPVLQHLEAADRDAELLARLGIFQCRVVQLADRADRLGTERTDRAVAAGFQRGDALAFLAEQFSTHAAQADLGGTASVDRLEAG
ncbi:hypothetical protein chiPu_0029193 [Chiloscyllium punctatum]|uniref:Uncharacterized protein n=1 Tax=Chiloscyllium punctatum TaxID=137246 RepID=A0A401TRS3_CHIPU|nr:hypothetical protein [Chiloscyllium punctatum]